MTRARAKAIEDKVNSLLSELPLSMHETWLLPKSEVLCMIRHQEGPPEDAHEDVQVPKSTDEENQRKEPRTSPKPQTSGHDPRHPAPRASPTTAVQPPEAKGPRHPAPTARTSGLPSPDIRRRLKARTSGPTSPDIRPPLSAHSEGSRPVYPFSP